MGAGLARSLLAPLANGGFLHPSSSRVNKDSNSAESGSIFPQYLFHPHASPRNEGRKGRASSLLESGAKMSFVTYRAAEPRPIFMRRLLRVELIRPNIQNEPIKRLENRNKAF